LGETLLVDRETCWHTVKGLAALLNCGTRPIYRAIQTGELRAAVINQRGDVRIADAWAREWLTARTDRREAVHA